VTISHHLDEATVMAFAAGNLGQAHATVVSAHLSVCPVCRANLMVMEGIGGGVLEAQAESPLSTSCRDATMARLTGAGAQQPKRAMAKRTHSDIPPALAEVLGGKSLDELPWKKRAPGIAVYDIPLQTGARGHLKLLSIAPGKEMPEHGHGGEELTLILRGSYSDHTGKYTAGDVADLDEETEHTPVVDSAEPCICLIAVDAPTKFKSFWARLAQPFVGI
jgi:putative transcriptional regulator